MMKIEFQSLLNTLMSFFFDKQAAFNWALSICTSRAMTLNGYKYLVPFADMFNHESHPVS